MPEVVRRAAYRSTDRAAAMNLADWVAAEIEQARARIARVIDRKIHFASRSRAQQRRRQRERLDKLERQV